VNISLKIFKNIDIDLQNMWLAEILESNNNNNYLFLRAKFCFLYLKLINSTELKCAKTIDFQISQQTEINKKIDG